VSFVHPGLDPDEDSPDEDVRAFQVRAAVMHVVRGADKWGQPVIAGYDRGETVQLTPGYAEPYLKAGLLRSIEPEEEDDDEAPRPTTRHKTPSTDDGDDS